MDPLTALAAFGPLAVKLGESLIGRFLGQADFKPATVADWLQMRASDLAMFQAINSAGQGGTGPSYPWVDAVIRLQRPAVAGVALGVWGFSHLAGTPSPEVNNFAACIGFYLFGDRTLFHISGAKAAPIKG